MGRASPSPHYVHQTYMVLFLSAEVVLVQDHFQVVKASVVLRDRTFVSMLNREVIGTRMRADNRSA